MSSFWADVFAHAAFFMGFLPMFYFVYVVPVQGNALVNDFFALLKDELTDMTLALNPNVKREIEEGIQTAASTEEKDPALANMTEDNPSVFKTTMLFLAIALPLLLITAVILQYRAGGSVTDLFLGNFIVIAFIAISEFAIVGIFVGNFVEIDKDFVKAQLLSGILLPNSDMSWGHNCNYVHQFAIAKFGTTLANLFLGGSGSTQLLPLIGPGGKRQMFGPGGTNW